MPNDRGDENQTLEGQMLQGRVAVVTGSGRGIGRAEATRLAAYGAKVVINDLGVATDGTETGETPAEEVVSEIRAAGGEAVADGSDISTAEGGEAVIQRALDEWGRVDIVVNNAGIGRPRMVFNLSEPEWDDVIRVHLKGTFSVTAPAARWWRSESKAGRGGYGRLVNTSTGLLLAAFHKTEEIVANMIKTKIPIGNAKCHHSNTIRSENFSRYCCVR